MKQTKKLTILHSNDMHGDFLAEQLDDKLVGGVSMLSGYLAKVRSEKENVIYAVSGDMFKGSIIDSEFQGISTIEIMNLLAPDIVTLGNHEIDYGVAHLLFIEKCARFPIINSNLFIKTNHVRLFTPYKILEVGGLNVMFIGVITDEILAQTKSDGLIGSFIDVREAAKEIAVICDNYKTTRVDYTVVLTHIGIEKDRELASLLDKNLNINLIIGGHSHTLMQQPETVNGIPIVQAACGTDQVGRAELEFSPDGSIKFDWKLVPIDASHCPTDPVIEQMISYYKDQTDKKYARVITTFARELTHPSRIQETELGNLFADLMQVDSSFDVMLFGSGSIRAQKLGPLVLYQDLQECLPYDDPIYMLEVTGEQFRKIVKHILRDEAYTGHTEFYQFSRGVKITYSKSKHELLECSLNGREVEDGDRIKIALQAYHFNNFDEFMGVPLAEVEKNRKPRMVCTSCFCIFEELLMNATHVDSKIEKRIELLD